MKLRIGTRGSDLALWQANHVRRALEARGSEVEILVLETKGDRIDDVPLQSVEGKAFFTAEIEQALYEGRVDLAVHSHKDLPVESPEGLVIAAVPQRANKEERLLVAPASHAPTAAFLPIRKGARVGTSSPRRQAQVKALRPDLDVLALRGNVPTRVERLRTGRYDAILLAAAGLERLELDTSDLVVLDLACELMVPAPAQGALALQTRAADSELRELCRDVFHDEKVARAIAAERSLLTLAGGGCNLALGAVLERNGKTWRARVFRGPDATDENRVPRWASAENDDPEQAASLAYLAAAGTAPTGCGPLAGLSAVVLGSKTEHSLLGDRMSTLGARVEHTAVIAYEDLDQADLYSELLKLEAGDAVVLTSAKSATFLRGLTLPAGVLLAAVGEATKRALEEAGQAVQVVGSDGGRALAERLPLSPGAKVLHPCAENALFELQEGLAEKGIEVLRVPVYRTVPRDAEHIEKELSRVSGEHHDVRLYMSPSSVEACLAWERAHTGELGMRVAIGQATLESLRDAGLDAFAPDAGDREEIVRRLLELRLTDGVESGAPATKDSLEVSP